MSELNNKIQLILSGFLGDGCLRENGAVHFSCKYKEYMDFKRSLCEDMSDVKWKLNKGYKEGDIYKVSLRTSDEGKEIHNSPFDHLDKMDELGLAMWLYDDGSLHKKQHFFNINSHSFTKDEQEKYLIPLLNRFNIYPKIISETKKDGRKFWYLTVSKNGGGYIISNILNKYRLNCYSYKIMPQEELERYNIIADRYKGRKVSRTTLSHILRAKVEDYDQFLNEKVFDANNDFIVLNKKANTEDKEHTVIL